MLTNYFRAECLGLTFLDNTAAVQDVKCITGSFSEIQILLNQNYAQITLFFQGVNGIFNLVDNGWLNALRRLVQNQ